LLNIDNKILPLQIWRYISIPLWYSTFASLPTNSIHFWQKFYVNNDWQSKCQISVKSAKPNNSYRAFVRSPQNISVSGLWVTSSTKTWNWSVMGWPHKSWC